MYGRDSAKDTRGGTPGARYIPLKQQDFPIFVPLPRSGMATRVNSRNPVIFLTETDLYVLFIYYRIHRRRSRNFSNCVGGYPLVSCFGMFGETINRASGTTATRYHLARDRVVGGDDRRRTDNDPPVVQRG